MIIFLKIVALVFAGIIFLAYGWWSRDYLSVIEKIFWLSPAFGLLIIGIMPFRILSLKPLRILPTFIFIIGIARTLNGIGSAVRSPIEPDTNAAMLNLIVLAILSIGIYLAWHPATTRTKTQGQA